MKKIIRFFETERGKRVKNLIIGLGASIVLLGALFKLQHWEGAGTMLIIGMCTEAFIFALLGILPPHKDYYWEKLYPELDIAPDEEELKMLKETHAHGTLTQQLDRAMAEHNVEPELIRRLGDNLKRLGESINQLRDLSDAQFATNDFSDKARQAAAALAEMKVAYTNATEAAKLLGEATHETRNYHEQVQQVSKNLAQLNAIYELELQDTNNHLKAMNRFYGSLSQAIVNLNESIDDTKRYRAEIAELAKNLASLNQIYGNMLSAMTMTRTS
ncbi:MAG: gliding motility protein GldL [Chitinophagales bacterium]|nr:gliding motility protein GldL [Chitinophagales bacterium]MDW8426968.1 gliding motility protein GldL [Chitinophagales bacterium]